MPEEGAPEMKTPTFIQYYLHRILQFYHNFGTSIDKGNLRQHLSSLFDQMVPEGSLIRGRLYERNWLGFRIVDYIVEFTIRGALYQGFYPWDRTLFHLGTLIVQMAICC